jgi:2',3'-cyclic-nucleotide 2'-phosphodiesterase (5'-nucleotidase family)
VSDFDLHGRLITQRWNSEINGAYASHDAVLEQLGNPLPNAEVVAISDALANVLAERDGNIIGKSAVYLEGRRNQVRSQETNLGNLTADANLWLAQQVNGDTLISIKNGGGIRDDIGYFAFPPGSTSADDLVFYPPEANPAAGKLAGDISQFDIQGALSFNNELSLVTVTAAQLRAIVEHGVAAATAGATPGQFPQVAGIRFSFDPALPAGSRVRNLAVVDAGQTLVDAVVQDGMLLGNAERTFRLVTLNFLAAGGDGYPFPQNAAANRLDLVGAGLAEGMVTFAAPGTEQDALAEYLNERFRNTPYSLAETPAQQDQRIQNLQLRTDGVF